LDCAKRNEDENKRRAEALAGQNTQLAEELAGASFPSLEEERRARVATISLPVLDEELERVDKGLKRLKEAMEADDIKKVRVHRRAMISDLAYVKGIVRAAAVRENWTDEQTSELIGKVNAKVATLLKSAEKILQVADFQAKEQWAERFITAAKKVQNLATNAHQYLKIDDWLRENAEEFLEDLRNLRSNAKKLRMTVPLEM